MNELLGDINKELANLKQKFNKIKSQKLNINMTRGVPCREQLDLSSELLNIDLSNYKVNDIGDLRSYVGLAGTSEVRELFKELIGAESAEEIIVGGNSSLNMMHDSLARAMLFGVCEGAEPWGKLMGRGETVKFLCPVPGYDRHFSICEFFGIQMININMTNSGPDMAQIREYIKDESVKGIWCVPKYSNPDGITYSDNCVREFANLCPKAKDFRIYWDNAYVVHDLFINNNKNDNLLDLFSELKKIGREDLVYIFASTSKITFPGSGVAAICASKNNIKFILSKMFIQTIGPDKINQTRHVVFLKNLANIKAHMSKHCAILRPKFEAVLNGLESNLGGLNIAEWTKPNGGYFVSLFVQKGCAKRVVELAGELGVILTPAGATYPYRNDLDDRNIRIAPSFPNVEDIKKAIEALCLCVKIAAEEKKL